MNKTCTRCEESKSEEAFGKKRNGKRQAWCLECHRSYHKQHYRDNKKDYVAKVAKQREELRNFIISLKNGPCTDCTKKFHHAAMDFDHVRGEKKCNVSEMYKRGSKRLILEEVAKCELVCSNCHRVRTFKRNQTPSSSPV